MTKARSTLPDGLDALRSELSVAEVMRLIERTALGQPGHLPPPARLVPRAQPARPVLQGRLVKPQTNRNRQTGIEVHKHEGNNYASRALTLALGLRSRDRPIWSCCHIWGVDDETFATTNTVVQDPRYYSCVANMVLLPTPPKAFHRCHA